MLVGPILPSPTIVAYVASSSMHLTGSFPFPAVTSGFWGGLFGGFFAGLFTTYFESRRRLFDKRSDKYFEHRNTIVQIEQELIPLRVDISRNISCFDDAIKYTNEENVRLTLRLEEVSLSTGLGLRLLNLKLINMYADLFSTVKKFNADIRYISDVVSRVIDDQKKGIVDSSLLYTYKIYLPYIRDLSEEIDTKSLDLLVFVKLAIGENENRLKRIYIKDGKEIKYFFDNNKLQKTRREINEEEYPSHGQGSGQPKFISLFLDLKKSV